MFLVFIFFTAGFIIPQTETLPLKLSRNPVSFFGFAIGLPSPILTTPSSVTDTVSTEESSVTKTTEVPNLQTDTTTVTTESTTQKHSLGESIIGCSDFECLLKKFEILQTPGGIVLTSVEKRDQLKMKNRKCKDNFSCWLKKFDISKKTYGFGLTLKSTETATTAPSLTTTSSSSSSMLIEKLSTSTESPFQFSEMDYDSIFSFGVSKVKSDDKIKEDLKIVRPNEKLLDESWQYDYNTVFLDDPQKGDVGHWSTSNFISKLRRK